MKKGKLFLSAMALVAVASIAFAFKAKPFAAHDLFGYNATSGYYLARPYSSTTGLNTTAPYILYKFTNPGYSVFATTGAIVKTTSIQ